MKFKPEEIGKMVSYHCSNYGSHWSNDDISSLTALLNARLEEMLKEAPVVDQKCPKCGTPNVSIIQTASEPWSLKPQPKK